MAYEQAFSKTPVDEIVVRQLPSGRWLATEMPGDYFARSDRLFMRLFDYIRDNDVAMTVPVEGTLEGAGMRFYAGNGAPPGLSDTGTVRIVDVPARQVVSIGGRGSYNEENLAEARVRLTQWLAEQTEWVGAGEPYGVFWSGPFTPWFVKRFEVHLPVQAAGGG